MELWVRVLEARNLRAMDYSGSSDPYVRLQLGEKKFRTKVVKKSLNPSWGEEFCFQVNDLDEELLVNVMDEDKYFRNDLVGQLKLHIERVYDAPNNSLGTVWYTLQPKNKKSKQRDCGQILLTIWFVEKNSSLEKIVASKGGNASPYRDRYADQTSESSSVSLNDILGLSLNSSSRSSSSMEAEETSATIVKKPDVKSFATRLTQTFPENGDDSAGLSVPNSPEISKPNIFKIDVNEHQMKKQCSDSTFDEAMRSMELKDPGVRVPSNLPGGVLLEQLYVIAPAELNFLLFSFESNFMSSLAEIKGNKERREEPWRFGSDGESLKRTVTYMKAATRMMKAVNAIEEQMYLKANGKDFAVLVSVSIPEATYGSTFTAETLYCITPGPELPSGNRSSRLVISWRINFLKSTMMKGMIEGGVRKGFKENFEYFASLLCQNVKTLELEDLVPDSPETPKFLIYGNNRNESRMKNHNSDCEFDEAMRIMESKDQGAEVPSELPGGVLVDQLYVVEPADLNMLLFSSETNFMGSLADMKGNKELQEEAWRFGSDGESLKRTVTYMKPATKMMKSVKAIEEQWYIKADGRIFAILVSVSTQDATYGNIYREETLYCIMPGPELPSGGRSSRLVISWHLNFLQSTMMKSMIEDTVRKGFKESFDQFLSLLSHNVKPIDMKDLVPDSPETPKFGIYEHNLNECQMKNQCSDCPFDEAMRSMELKDPGVEIPDNLPGGVLLEELYVIAPADLNILLFSSESNFRSSLAEMRGDKELLEKPWRFGINGESFKRIVTYMKAATKMMKSVKAIEDQTYLVANGNVFAILVSVSTPDAMYGSTFRAETLYCITPGPGLPSGEKSSRLVISWRINFLQSSMMKGMIENGARKGFKESFEQFANLLSQTAVPVHVKDLVPDTSETPKSDRHENLSNEHKMKSEYSDSNFDEAMRIMELKDHGVDVPSNLPGGVLVDQAYVVEPADLNILLFSSESKFTSSLADMKGNNELQEEPWRFGSDGGSLKRAVTYMKAPTKMMKAVKAIEEQMYLKANGNIFAVLVSVSTPDAKFGGTFRAETLYCIMPGPELPSGEKSSRLVISWRINFLQSTMMKGMIEGGARKAFKESFENFSNLLSQNVKLVDLKDLGSNKEHILASLQVEKQSDLTLAAQYLLNFTVVSAACFGLYVLMHIILAKTHTFQGLEFSGLDLPDSFAEMIVCAILVLQGQRALPMISRFMQARVQKGSDHGVKAQGDGWVLTIALIEGSNVAAIDSTGFSDPYVIFTCNGKTKTSSIKFQKLDPQWNEVYEFDAMDEPPSILDVEVFGFEGPFDEATSLGHAEINFVKSNISDLSDIWIPLQGKSAQPCQSKLHLGIFLNNTKGSNAIKEYLTKMEKEVGKKIKVPSPQTNAAFQKLFGLPPEEFLINEFTCRLKRKMLLQGRLFLSARIIGFHAILFGNRTNFFFLWEDIEDIQVLSPTLTSMGSPSLIIILWRGKGLDARQGAKKEDEEGRLKFHFHSFVSFSVAQRTIMALWKAKSLSLEQKMQIVDEESEGKDTQNEENGSLLDLEDASMSEVYSSAVPVPIKFFMGLFGGGYLECKVMEKVGCVDYSHTSWVLAKPDVYQRQIGYKFDKHVSHYRGDATSIQQLCSSSKRNGWVVEEVLTLHGIPLGDYFNVHIRYQVEDLSKSKACNVQILFGISWLKSSKHQKKLMKNIESNVVDRLKSMFSHVEKEYMQEN
ncbi:C2 and gram domain-containing protein [Thalictrum thalictroides]|uniref:C2 and gram domain-containing protein n=1 Tax=Thalictrum thalictroides TaxID=46969 RepID=A0A7J6V2S6_THATH|nr:C2 and gram domain-containing protein [Thalictrum thalictroides]